MLFHQVKEIKFWIYLSRLDSIFLLKKNWGQRGLSIPTRINSLFSIWTIFQRWKLMNSSPRETKFDTVINYQLINISRIIWRLTVSRDCTLSNFREPKSFRHLFVHWDSFPFVFVFVLFFLFWYNFLFLQTNFIINYSVEYPGRCEIRHIESLCLFLFVVSSML